jgi:uncharacterized peroxidase-related enzyme
VHHHAAGLIPLAKDDQLVAAVVKDYRESNISDQDRAMLDYAVKLTLVPAKITDSDVQALRKAGFDDRAILDICQVTAYFNFVNRIALGLGVELETKT